ncbi:MAG TPA: secondary thiamine-phosphate synthase enzyme YjbQ [Blastocatellia bacterium]
MSSAKITISSKRNKQVLDITSKAEQVLSRSGVTEGLCNVFVMHTTAAITTGEAIEGTDEDLMEVLERLIPDIDFRHAHDPSHAPDHMISSILGPGVTVPISNGRLQLGTWQRILFVECNGPRDRECIVTVVG